MFKYIFCRGRIPHTTLAWQRYLLIMRPEKLCGELAALLADIWRDCSISGEFVLLLAHFALNYYICLDKNAEICQKNISCRAISDRSIS